MIADLADRHRAQEVLQLLNLVNRTAPDGLDVHVIVDNSPAHKTPPCTAGWCHPRFTLHVTPG